MVLPVDTLPPHIPDSGREYLGNIYRRSQANPPNLEDEKTGDTGTSFIDRFIDPLRRFTNSYDAFAERNRNAVTGFTQKYDDFAERNRNAISEFTANYDAFAERNRNAVSGAYDAISGDGIKSGLIVGGLALGAFALVAIAVNNKTK